MQFRSAQNVSLSISLLITFSASAAELGTRQRTITPVALTNVPGIFASDLALYETNGYSSWQQGSGQNVGQLTTNMMPNSYLGATSVARLLAFFCFSDIHLTDKETPSWPYWSAYQTQPGFTKNSTLPPGDGNASAYSPVMLSTTHVLDAAVRTATRCPKPPAGRVWGLEIFPGGVQWSFLPGEHPTRPSS